MLIKRKFRKKFNFLFHILTIPHMCRMTLVEGGQGHGLKKLNLLENARLTSNSPRLKRRSLFGLLRMRWPWIHPLGRWSRHVGSTG